MTPDLVAHVNSVEADVVDVEVVGDGDGGDDEEPVVVLELVELLVPRSADPGNRMPSLANVPVKAMARIKSPACFEVIVLGRYGFGLDLVLILIIKRPNVQRVLLI